LPPPPVTPPSLLIEKPFPSELFSLHKEIMRNMEAIARFDTTIAAMCLRRSQLHTQVTTPTALYV
jgi:hypothetical protein